MIQPGKIVIGIDRKVYFEYYLLEKPNWGIHLAYFVKHGCNLEHIQGLYNEKMKKYEASKKLIKVSNVFWGELCKKWFYEDILCYDDRVVKDGDFCKAEVTDNKATIVELIK